MASNKDVELRITARDTSRKTFQQLSKTVRDLTDAMKEQQDAASRGEVSADALEKSFTRLERAGAALAKQSALIDLYNAQARAMSDAKASGDSLRQSASELQRQIAQQESATKAQTAEMKNYESAIKKADSALVRAENGMAKTASRLERLGINTADFAAAQASMVADVTRANATLEAQDKVIEGYSNAQFLMTQALKKAATQALATSANFDRLGAAQGKLATAFSGLADEVDGIMNPTNKARESLDGLEKSISEVGAAIVQLKGPVKNASALMAELAKNQRAVTESAGLVDNFQQQTAALRQARTEYAAARRQVKELANEIQNTSKPTEQMGQALRDAETRLKAAHKELTTLSSKARASQAELKAAGINTRDLTSEQDRLRTMAQSTAGQIDSLKAAVDRYGNASNNAAGKINIFNDSGRKTLSWLQRIRGEVLSTVAAYAGFSASVSALSDALDAYRARQAVTYSLTAVVGHDTEKLAAEWEYITKVAKDMRQPIQDVGKSYADFSISMSSAKMSTEQTRYIFESFTKAGLAMKRTPEEMKRVFYALTQIGSKGKVMSEELRQQLGDVIPGIAGMMSEALGMTSLEVDKLMQSTEGLSSDALMNLADVLNNKFSAAAESAKHSLQSSINTMKNAWYELQIMVTEGGLADAVKDVSDRMSEFLKTDDARDFAESLGEALRSLGDIVMTLIENFDIVVSILKTFMAMKAAQWALNAGIALGNAAIKARLLATSLLAATTATGGTITSIGALTLALKVLTRAIPFIGMALMAWDIGKLFYEQSETVKGAVESVVDWIKAAWASITGFFSGSTKTFKENLAELKKARDDAKKDKPKDKPENLSTPRPEGGWSKEEQTQKQLDREIEQAGKRLDKQQLNASMAENRDNLAARKALVAERYKDMLAQAQAMKDGGKRLAEVQKLILRDQQIEEQKFNTEQSRRRGRNGNAEVNRAEKLANRIAAIRDDLRAKLLKSGDRGDYEVVENAAVTAALAKQEELQRQVNNLKGAAKKAAQEELAVVKQLTEEYARQTERRKEANERKKDIEQLKKIRDAQLQVLKARLLSSDPSVTGDNYEQQYKAIQAGAVSDINKATDALAAFISKYKESLDPAQVEQYLAYIQQVRLEMEKAADSTSALQTEMGSITLNSGLSALNDGLTQTRDNLAGIISQTKTWGDLWSSLTTTVMKFFSDLLLQLAQAILKQMVLNSLSSYAGSGGMMGAIGSAAASMVGGTVSHTGSVIGHNSGAQARRSVPASVFSGAQKFHTGGLPGLKPDEVPSILQKGEEVLTRDDPRNILNGGKQSDGGNTRVVLVDDQSRIADALAGAEGERVVIQHLKRNIPTLRSLTK